MKVGLSAPRYEAMALLYPRSKKLQSHLSEYFIVVVRLCHHLLRYTQKSVLGKLAAPLGDSEMMTYQSDLDSWANHIKEEVFFLSSQKAEEEARESKIFRGLSSKAAKYESYRLILKTKLRILHLCSTFDHEKVWKRIRKAGNTTLFDQAAEYQHWKSQTKSSVLIFTGKLGSGKSVLLANIVDDLNLGVQGTASGQSLPAVQRIAVAYFFCRDDLPESLKARTIIGSLARQLLHQIPDLTGVMEYLQDLSLTVDCEGILKVLRRALPSTFKAYFVLDGLDECDEAERKETVLQLLKVQEAFALRICISLRSEPNNTLALHREEFATASIIAISDDNPDIMHFIDAELESCIKSGRLSIGNPALILEIQDALLRGSQGMFLWVALQIKSLSTVKTDNDIRLALADLPKDLSETYSRVLQKSNDLDYQRRILQLVTVAQRPLTTEELREALSVVPGNNVWNPAMLITDVYSILGCCGSLIVIDEEELIVHFIHHSVKQFLLHKYTDSSTGEFTMKSCNRQMTDVIVTYLNYGIFDTRLSTKVVTPMPVRSAPSTIIRSALDSSTTVRGLALRLLKSRRQPDFDIGKTLAEASNLVKTPSVGDFHFYAYAKSYWFHHISSSPRQECYELLREVLDNGTADANATNNGGMTPLAYAIDYGNVVIVKVLLEMDKINVNLPDTKYGRTPLGWAARQGNQTMVKLLLETGDADPNLREMWYGWTPLICATYHGHEAVARLLLENDDVDPDLEDAICGRTPLSFAAQHKRDSVVKLLLETRMVILETRKMILKTSKVNPDSADSQQRTPLSWAAQYGNDSVVKLLLRTRKVNPDSADSRQRTPLSWAAQRGNDSVVKLLLETRKVNPDSVDSQQRTPLSWAAQRGNDSVVKLLLETSNVNPDSADSQQRTPLSWAAQHGNHSVVKLLLETSKSDSADSLEDTTIVGCSTRERFSGETVTGDEKGESRFRGQPTTDTTIVGCTTREQADCQPATRNRHG